MVRVCFRDSEKQQRIRESIHGTPGCDIKFSPPMSHSRCHIRLIRRINRKNFFSNVRSFLLFTSQECEGEATKTDGPEEDPAARHPSYFTSTGTDISNRERERERCAINRIVCVNNNVFVRLDRSGLRYDLFRNTSASHHHREMNETTFYECVRGSSKSPITYPSKTVSYLLSPSIDFYVR